MIVVIETWSGLKFPVPVCISLGNVTVKVGEDLYCLLWILKMSRRGSTPASSKKTSTSSKRVSLKDGNLLGGAYRQSHGDIREGDTFYKTIKFYPSISDLPDDVSVNVARASRETRAGSSAGGAESRRGSVLSRDESSSPSLGRTESPIKERYSRTCSSNSC